MAAIFSCSHCFLPYLLERKKEGNIYKSPIKSSHPLFKVWRLSKEEPS